MRLKLALVASGGLIAATVGGYILTRPSNDIAGAEKSETNDVEVFSSRPLEIPQVMPESTGQGKSVMVIPGDVDDGYETVYKKYGRHFNRKSAEFVEAMGLEIPWINAENEVYEEWGNRENEIRDRYVEEFGVGVDDDTYLHPDNIGITLWEAILNLCSGIDEVRKAKYCVVDDGDMNLD